MPAKDPTDWLIYEASGFGNCPLLEGQDLEPIWQLARAIAGSDRPEVVIAAAETWPDDWAAVTAQPKGVFAVGKYAEHLFDELFRDPEAHPLLDYIDWHRYEDDLIRNGEIAVLVVGGTRHVFAL